MSVIVADLTPSVMGCIKDGAMRRERQWNVSLSHHKWYGILEWLPELADTANV